MLAILWISFNKWSIVWLFVMHKHIATFPITISYINNTNLASWNERIGLFKINSNLDLIFYNCILKSWNEQIYGYSRKYLQTTNHRAHFTTFHMQKSLTRCRVRLDFRCTNITSILSKVKQQWMTWIPSKSMIIIVAPQTPYVITNTDQMNSVHRWWESNNLR